MTGATRKPGFTVAVLATLLAAVVVLLGAYTRLTHAGLGCPDWPGCYGFVHVPLSEAQLAHAELHFPDAPVEAQKGWNEMIHRYFAGALGLLILGLALHALVRRGRDGQPLKLPLLLLAVVIAQAAFGMWTVTLKLWPQVVTAHLLGGFTTLALLFLLALRLSGRFAARRYPAATRGLAGLALLLVIGQIALGGWVSSNYAAVACIDLPTCHGEWWPRMDFANGFHLTQHIGPNYLGGQLDSDARTAIHMTHRIGALCVTEKRSVRPADLQTRLEGLVLHGQKDFVTAGDSASWWLVAARDEAPGQPPRLSMTVVLAGAPGARLEALPALPLMPDVPHSRLLLDGAHCERLPGDGWDDYVRPFRLLEDVHVLAALVGWLYGVGHECGWPSPLLLRLAGILGGCAEVARHPVACVGTQAVLAGLFEQFSALEGQLDAAFAANASTWEALWQRDRGLLAIANGARKVRLEKALTRLGLDPGQ